MEQWVKILQKLNTIGTFECTQGSDVTGDPDIGTKYQCRLSVPQAKQAFMKAQGQQGDSPDAALLEFSEMEECIARCAVDKYALCMKQWLPSHNRYMFTMADAVRAFLANLLFEKGEGQAPHTAHLP